MEYRSSDLPLSPKTEIGEYGIDALYTYLAKRGIMQADLDPLGIRLLRAQDIGRGGDPRGAIVFPHYDMSGNTIDWWSARLVEMAPPAGGFAALTVPKKQIKMFCPAKTPPAAYLPPTLDWGKIKTGSTIYIHESVIKAVCGAKLGLYSVGLNGVWGWGSKLHQIALVSQLCDLPWKRKELKCVIVFDSNACDNEDVVGAVKRLAQRLTDICKIEVRHKLMPMSDTGAHWGFDDMYALWGPKRTKEWLTSEEGLSLVEWEETGMMKAELNQRVCVVTELKRVADQEDGTLMSRGEFIDMNFADWVTFVDDKPVSVPRLWLTWDRRCKVKRLQYAPGEDKLVEGEFLNLWKGMGCEPDDRAGVEPWLALLTHNLRDVGLRRWLIQWLAYPLQNLGAKCFTYVYMYGVGGGGKNALLDPFIKIYGDNYVELSKERLVSDFNSAYAARQFVNLNEPHGEKADAMVVANKLKVMTTSPKIMVNTKGQVEYQVDNHLNICITSNYNDSVKLDNDDRRAAVFKFGDLETLITDKAYWDAYYLWSRTGGAEALYSYLLQVPMVEGDGWETFDPAGRAPYTEWKEEVTDCGRSPMESWCIDLREEPDSVLPPILRGAKVLTPEQLGAAYYPNDPLKNTPGFRRALGRAMGNAGFKSKTAKAPDKLNFWIIADRGRFWEGFEIREEYERITRKGKKII